MFGAVKTPSGSPEQETVKVAAILLLPEGADLASMDEIWAGRLVFAFERTIATIENLTRTAASNGAKIISFQEFAMMIYEEDEHSLKEEFQRIAIENDVFLSISYAYYSESNYVL